MAFAEKRSAARQTVQKRGRLQKTVQPAHRVVQREVIAWANGLNGRAPKGADIAALIKDLTIAVEADRMRFSRYRRGMSQNL
jgi:hypoxanthine-guanine phosphoribosyltransferase